MTVIFAWVASFFAKEAVGKFLTVAWNVISNPIGAALIAATLSGFFFSIRENRIVHAEWTAADEAATARNERDRLARDAFIKATMEKNADERLAGLTARNAVLEKKADEYDAYLILHPLGGCILTGADERGMYIDGRKAGPPRGRTYRLFTPSGQPKAP
jgi:hypothetical protein